MNTNLLDETLALARNTQALAPAHNKRALVTDICRAVNVTTRWYYKLLAGEIQDPSVRRVQRLHDYLVAQATAAHGLNQEQKKAGAA